MITNPLFRECLANVSDETRAEFNLSFEIADRIDALLKQKGITQKELAAKMGKRESEISKWLTGRHNFTTKTLAGISLALGEPIISVPA
ncbi:MAG: helix-turn-helix transcriptional regulator [Prevotella sp.]|nr:helix-turn-helix transcriptional regulator [Prevotella sp.]